MSGRFRPAKPNRNKLEQLFTKVWRITEEKVEEVGAGETLASMTDEQRDEARMLVDPALPVAAFSAATGELKFSYEVMIPWEAFPPGDRLYLERIRFSLTGLIGGKVEVSSEYYGDEGNLPTGQRTLGLQQVVGAQFTPCRYAMVERMGEPVFAFWDQQRQVRKAFRFYNRVACCGYRTNPPEGALSPRVAPVVRTAQTLGPGETLCGPPMAYRKGNVIKRFDFDLGPGVDFYPLGAAPGKVAVHRLPDGVRLLRDGPDSSLRIQSNTAGSSAPWGGMAIYALLPNGEIEQALEFRERTGDDVLGDYDFEVSADWTKVTEFKQSLTGKWSATYYCLEWHAYRRCGEDKVVVKKGRGLLRSLE